MQMVGLANAQHNYHVYHVEVCQEMAKSVINAAEMSGWTRRGVWTVLVVSFEKLHSPSVADNTKSPFKIHY